MPYLVGALSEQLLDALDRALVDQVGRDAADLVLAAFDEEIAGLARRSRIGAEIAEEAGVIKVLKQRTLEKLAGTTGLQWAPWRRGNYVVTWDGKYIGDIRPRKTTLGSGPPRYDTYAGQLHGALEETREYRTAKATAQRIGEDYAQANGLTVDSN
jgi:hypothetical protein